MKKTKKYHEPATVDLVDVLKGVTENTGRGSFYGSSMFMLQ